MTFDLESAVAPGVFGVGVITLCWCFRQGSHLLQPPGPASVPVLHHAVRETADRRGGNQHLWLGMSSSRRTAQHRPVRMWEWGLGGEVGVVEWMHTSLSWSCVLARHVSVKVSAARGHLEPKLGLSNNV